MKTVSFQGTQLTDSQRRRLCLQQQLRPTARPELLSPIVADTTDDTPRRQWFVVRQERGTPYVGDIFKF